MKFISYLSLAAACLVHVSSAYSADADLVGLIKEARRASAMEPYLEQITVTPQTKDDQRRALKPISAFGGVFDGEVAFKAETQSELRLWTKEPLLSPEAASELFDKMARSLKSELGQGRTVANVPNYGDVAEVKSTAVLWLIGTDIVFLHLERYPSRGGIGVVRRNSEAWRNSMGADESDFWVKTLDPKINAEPRPERHAELTLSKSINPPPTPQLSSPTKAPSTSPTSTPSDEPTSPTPWSVIVVLIVATCGLLWLVLKRRS
ncbi:MAG: hypothetical protein RLZZ179_3025 [Verrucomicrobiota bacterium]|jgi:hypothetical protein